MLGETHKTPESALFKQSRIKIVNPGMTLVFIRQVALSDEGEFKKANNKTIVPLFPNQSRGNEDYEKQKDSCILQERPDNLRIVGHYDKKHHGISVSNVDNFRADVSAGKTFARDVGRSIQATLIAKFEDKFGLKEDSSRAVSIITPHGFTLSLNAFEANVDVFSASTEVIGSFRFAVSTAKIKESGQYGRERIVDFQDDRIIPVTAENIQIYFDDIALVYDEARKVFEDFGFKLPAIEAEIISRPKKETRISDNIRASLGDVSENFVIRDPNVRFNDVIGHEDILTQLRDIINALKDPEARKELLDLPSGILLHGAPGCGKTYLAEAVATESGCKFLYIQPSVLFDVPEAKDVIKVLFEEMKDEKKPTMVFIDEADTFFRRRESLSQQRAEVVSSFLANLDGIGRNHKAFLVLASNRPDLIDPAMYRSGRIDYSLEVKPPTKGDRMRLFRYFISLVGNLGQNGYDQKIFNPDIFTGEEGMVELSTNAESLTQADIRTIVNRALLKRWSTDERPPITLSDLLTEINKIKSSRITPQEN